MQGKVLKNDVKETKERIVNAVKTACRGQCDLVEIKESATTGSLYFTISNGRIKTFFRISNHPTNKKIKSFTVSKNTKIDAIVRFVIGNINRLNKCSLYQTLDFIGNDMHVACM